MLQNLGSLLPSDGRETQQSSNEFSLVPSVIVFLHALFAFKTEDIQVLSDLDKESPQVELETSKRQFQEEAGNRQIFSGVAKLLLPRIFVAYEASINQQFRIKTLEVIDKVISLLDNALLSEFVEPRQFANFVQQIMKSKHSGSMQVSLQITRKVLDTNPF